MYPQILPDCPLGKRLTELASEAEVIVEVGTGCGLGSTMCLWNGLRKPGDSVLYTIEADYDTFIKAEASLPKDDQLVMFTGKLHDTIRPYFHPVDSVQDRETWEFESELILDVVDIDLECDIPTKIDLLFLDGGEFTSDGDFLRLWQRSKIIVLDDCNKDKATKNVYALNCLIQAGWKHELNLLDRHGWGIFWRP